MSTKERKAAAGPWKLCRGSADASPRLCCDLKKSRLASLDGVAQRG